MPVVVVVVRVVVRVKGYWLVRASTAGAVGVSVLACSRTFLCFVMIAMVLGSSITASVRA